MSDPIIRIENLNACYEGNQILSSINAEIYPEDITVILGASGSGKTTLLRNILGLTQPCSGKIELLGKDITKISEKEFNELLTRIGMVFQQGALLESVSLADNVAIPLIQHTNLKKTIISRIVKNKLDLVGLSDHATVYPAELSGGMRKRAAMARAIALDPEILFCDEPTAGLDPVTTESMDTLLLDLKKQLDISMVIVSHDIRSVKRTADRILFLHEGCLLYDGLKDGILESGIEELKRYFSL